MLNYIKPESYKDGLERTIKITNLYANQTYPYPTKPTGHDEYESQIIKKSILRDMKIWIKTWHETFMDKKGI